MQHIRYIGNFPPPYGGVTIKNQLLYDELSKYCKIHILKKKKWMPNFLYQVLNCLCSLLPNQCLIIGISSKGGKSLLQTKLIYYLNKTTMQRSIYFMMGGQEAGRIAFYSRERIMYKQYKKIYVETLSMKKVLEESGLRNVDVFPNCRNKNRTDNYLKKRIEILGCTDIFTTVYFSYVSPTKGVDIVIEAAKILSNVEFHIYGEIQADFENEFYTIIREIPNLKYHGVFKGKGDSVYNELAKYHIMLFPTKCEGEGVPGVLIEAKMAGLPAIVSNICYNTEIICNGIDGIVLDDTTTDNLVSAIDSLNQNRILLQQMVNKASVSANKYFIENYVDRIMEELRSC